MNLTMIPPLMILCSESDSNWEEEEAGEAAASTSKSPPQNEKARMRSLSPVPSMAQAQPTPPLPARRGNKKTKKVPSIKIGHGRKFCDVCKTVHHYKTACKTICYVGSVTTVQEGEGSRKTKTPGTSTLKKGMHPCLKFAASGIALLAALALCCMLA